VRYLVTRTQTITVDADTEFEALRYGAQELDEIGGETEDLYAEEISDGGS
jgi:hypothetical protein